MPARVIVAIRIEDLALSVEVKRHPALDGKPVVIGPDPRRGRGWVISASRPAKTNGIEKGMPIRSAFKILPNAIFLRPDRTECKKSSDALALFLKQRCDRLQRSSIDEFFLDISSQARKCRSIEDLAISIISDARQRLGLDIALGIGPNKLIAKTASDSAIPGRFLIVSASNVGTFLSPLPVRRLYGIGQKTEGVLKGLGINTIGQLARMPRERLVEQFGCFGRRIHQLANGIDESPVIPEDGKRSIVRSMVFEESILDLTSASKAADCLCAELLSALRNERAFFRTVGVMVRFDDDHVKCRQKTASYSSCRFEDMTSMSHELIGEMMKSQKPVRAISVVVAGLTQRCSSQKTMREYAASEGSARKSQSLNNNPPIQSPRPIHNQFKTIPAFAS